MSNNTPIDIDKIDNEPEVEYQRIHVLGWGYINPNDEYGYKAFKRLFPNLYNSNRIKLKISLCDYYNKLKVVYENLSLMESINTSTWYINNNPIYNKLINKL